MSSGTPNPCSDRERNKRAAWTCKTAQLAPEAKTLSNTAFAVLSSVLLNLGGHPQVPSARLIIHYLKELSILRLVFSKMPSVQQTARQHEHDSS